jgi:hypothetical protein
VSEFAAKDLRKVQNKIGFIRGMVKKMIEREREAGEGGGGAPQGMGMGGPGHSHSYHPGGGRPGRQHDRY